MATDNLKYLNEKGKTRTYYTNIWGFCDSLNVYIKYKSKYCLIAVYPIYSYFFYAGKINLPLGNIGTVGISVPIKHDIDYAIEMKRGRVFKLSNSSLKNILEDDPDLLLRYENEDKRKEKRLQYLVEYNKRNASKANE